MRWWRLRLLKEFRDGGILLGDFGFVG